MLRNSIKVAIWKGNDPRKWVLHKSNLLLPLALSEIAKLPEPEIILVSERGAQIVKRRKGVSL